MFFSSDHLIEKVNIFNNAIYKNKSNLTDQNIFIFGIKPKSPSSEYGYFLTKKVKGNINKVTKFIEKPKEAKAKLVIKKKVYLFFSVIWGVRTMDRVFVNWNAV